MGERKRTWKLLGFIGVYRDYVGFTLRSEWDNGKEHGKL